MVNVAERDPPAPILRAFVLGIPEHKLRVIAPDVGGGFGSKIFCYNEETMVTWASSRVGRPIKWTAERSESFQTDAHGRDHVTHAELALDKDGKFLGLKVDTIANMGAYLSTFSTACPPISMRRCLRPVHTPCLRQSKRRRRRHRAGRPIAAPDGPRDYVIEPSSQGGQGNEVDPAECAEKTSSRRRPSVPDAGGAQYDSGNYPDQRRASRCDTRASKRAAPRPSARQSWWLGFSSYLERGAGPSRRHRQRGGWRPVGGRRDQSPRRARPA